MLPTTVAGNRSPAAPGKDPYMKGSCLPPVKSNTSSMTRRNILSTSMPGSVRCFASAVAKGLSAPSPSAAMVPSFAE